MRFWLGVFSPNWLSMTDVPLFVSRNRLVGRITFPRATAPWAVDSGGFTEISKYGQWRMSGVEYARYVRLWQREIGNLVWAAPQDWMCEPPQLLRAMVAEGVIDLPRTPRGLAQRIRKKRGSGAKPTVNEILSEAYGRDGLGFPNIKLLRQRVCVHQRRTIDNYINLREIAPEVPWIPVLQGWEAPDYISHLEAYARAGIDLARQPIVGLGSVCRRKKLGTAEEVIYDLASRGIKLHGFGLKKDALRNPVIAAGLVSSDSMAWSMGARRAEGRLCSSDHTGGDKCSSCLAYALEWREETVGAWRSAVEERVSAAANPGGRWRPDNSPWIM